MALGDADGALIPITAPRRVWGIVYNEESTSLGRKNFTLAHEAGHYLVHRLRYPGGLSMHEERRAERCP